MKIKSGTWLTLEDGTKCVVLDSDKNGYRYYLNFWGHNLNDVPEDFLEDSIKYNQPIPIQEWYKDGTWGIKYLRIVKINENPVKQNEFNFNEFHVVRVKRVQ